MNQNHTTHHIKVIISPVFELLASMYRLQSHEELEINNDNDPKNTGADDPHQFKLNQWVEKTRNTLSEHIKKELEVFFHYESFIGLTMIGFALKNNCYESIEEFISVLERTPADQLYSSFLQTGFTPEDTVDPNDFKAVIQFIRKSNLPEIEKWKLSYLYTDLKETKNRLIKLITLCYEHYFSQEVMSWLEHQTKSAQEIRALIDSRGKEILKDIFPFFRTHGEVIDSAQSIVLCPSYFYHKASLSSELAERNCHLYVYGVQHVRSLEETTIDEKQAFDAFKILADEKRIRIIKHLSNGALYGYELAQKLELSNSTISHHLSVLASIGIVSSTRMENKVYFKVNKDEIEKLMQHLTKSLMN
ncbi:ArsR/SmtB family transcription factor [Bacillus horti]|uniref:DNA-binding transcriptional ArsR family regulator/uncharacterized protein YdhG (YjbR/CyaY superfamily) n=1 Tax=Caldalkalibacillus horti TaxID=77523 RepID=A0ABT9VYA2_9BACI|nr:metalloregulator ArsR/SmtB family transcription factor [Bacillus horti]MDQ0165961.1 DNA-binding transcriptional ArsR family regulator/uncharacterized protein YdhG (YjbR/CyaY superfamily) [Bacillus horti]